MRVVGRLVLRDGTTIEISDRASFEEAVKYLKAIGEKLGYNQEIYDEVTIQTCPCECGWAVVVDWKERILKWSSP